MLTDREIRAYKPATRPYKRLDGGGLYLAILPTGTRSWRLRYGLSGKRKVLVLGRYPEMSLADARERRNEAKALLREGRDPAAGRLAAHGADFEGVARDWHQRQAPSWRPRYAADVIANLERDAFPALGRLPIASIAPATILAVLRAMENRGAIALAHKVRRLIDSVFDYAVDTHFCQANPVPRSRALTRRPHAKRPAIVELPAFLAMLRELEAIAAYPVTKLAIRLLALTAVRPGEACGARWDEFEGLDGPAPTWIIPAARMKGGEKHVVPLARAAADVILALRPLTGRRKFVFGSSRHDGPITIHALNRLLMRAGFGGVHCGHGFRSSFATVMTKAHPTDRDAIEAQLAHLVPGTRGRYVRETFVERRRELAAEWAGLILGGAPSASVLLLGRRC
jgi:integrase